ncbi:response regulator [Roseococcus sp. SYP-B2431]|uniref:hybrid sensor histidine kinase/response regulator n=1 Tax=Roseococcus sp. SYP-B2431 TaxID=2496640 RepID=UPI00103FC926|nr:PAS domain-containing protein [Roseococcus sp. SYP-B2431]TCH96464.1 response regulator [Roseococcus sp. SYP-B2431]
MTAPAFLAGGGALGALMRAQDWSATALGPSESWPQSLRSAVRIMLSTGHPMAIYWGPSLISLYNDAFRDLIGSERHPRSLGRPAREVWTEVWDIIGPQIGQVMSGSGSVWQENALVPMRRDGRLADSYWTYGYDPIDDPEAPGGIGGVLVICAETTATVLAERRRQGEAERQRRIFDQAPGFICIMTGPDHVYEYVNNAHREIFNSGGWIGKPARQAGADIGTPQLFELLDNVYATGERYVARSAAIRFRRTPGEPEREVILDVLYAPITDDGGRVTGIFSEGFDVTGLRENERRLQELNETLERRVQEALAGRKLLADVVESTELFIQVADPGFNWLAINRASAREFKRIFGIAPKVGDNMLEALRALPEHREAVRAVWSRALTGDTFTAIGRFGHPAYDQRDYEMRFSPLRDREGKVVGAYQFVTDVTDRLRDQARLAEAEEHLRQAQKIEAIGQLTGGVAHDFNNLLQVISGGISLLELGIEEERRQRVLEGMRQAADRGASLTRQLLSFSRRQALRSESVDLRRQIEGMRELLERTLRGGGRIRLHFAADLWSAMVDPVELELAVLNLCANARDAMPAGGTIIISGDNEAGLDRDGLRGDFVRLAVTDTGAGMSEEVQARAFEPFFTTKGVGEGSGLGLPQVYGFARQSGGSVAIESIPGRGTTVTLLLPRAQTAPAASPRHLLDFRRTAQARVGEMLLVEDDDEVAALVAEMARGLGYGVTRAASGEAALGALANGRRIDVVFSDVMMPGGMNGIELARELRRRRPDLPVLLTSGYAAGVQGQADADGIEILQKPYRMKDFAKALERLLSGEGGSAAT